LLQSMDAAAAFASKKTEAIVRLDAPHETPETMKKILDSMRLPGGILVPMVDNAEMAKRVVQATRYPRQQASNSSGGGGVRGCAVPFVRASGWGSLSNDEYLRQCKEDLLITVQVETPQAVDAIPEIAKVEGIDLIFLGPFDLSCSIGKMGMFEDAEVKELISRAERAVLESGCLLGGFRTPGVSLEELFGARGYSLLCGAVDLGLLRDAARLDAQAGREAMKEDQ